MQRSLRLYLPLSSLLLLLLPLMGLLALTAATRSAAAGSRSRHRRLVRQWGVLLDGSAAADGTVRVHADCPSDAKQDAQPCLQALIDRMHAVPTDPAIQWRHPNPSCLIVLPAGAEYLINAPLRVND